MYDPEMDWISEEVAAWAWKRFMDLEWERVRKILLTWPENVSSEPIQLDTKRKKRGKKKAA